MSWETIQVLLTHELRMLFRDRRAVIAAVVLPLLVMPLLLYGERRINQRRRQNLAQTVYKYALTGRDTSMVRALLERARESKPNAKVWAPKEETSLENFKFQEVVVKDPAASLQNKEIHFYLEALDDVQANARPGKEKATKAGESTQPYAVRKGILPVATRLPGVPLILICYLADWDVSRAGQVRMRELLLSEREADGDALLRQHGFSIDPLEVFRLEERNLASAGQVTGSYIGRFLTLFLVMLLLSGGSVAALDIVAGEKEAGSLETLLTTAARRVEIVAAKQLAILIVGMLITVINTANVLAYVTFRLIRLPKDFVIEAPPSTVLTLLLLFIPLAAFISSILLMLSAYAKSYKEAQLYFFPVYLVSMVPALASVLPGLPLRSAISVVPLANVSVAVREILVGKFDWPMIGLTFIVMTAAAGWTMWQSGKMLSQERLITSSEADVADFVGGPALFPRHVLRWYALLGVILFSVALNVPQLATLRRQVAFNELVIFLGGPLLLIWRYRLNLKEALALRAVKPAVWLAVFLLIPAGNLVGVGVFLLADKVVPVPRQMLEQFGREVLPADMPLWMIFLFLAVLPGICEEIAFRGTLLYGLRRRLRPAGLAVSVGLIFGLFHVALFRIIPTAFLGVVLTAIAILTGSIFPGIALHIGNNAFALWAGRRGVPLAELGWEVYLAAVVVFGLAFYILYRERTLYPDLRLSGSDRAKQPMP